MSRPVAGQAIADQAWRSYSAVWSRYLDGSATLDEVTAARAEYDDAQQACESPLSLSSKHTMRHRRSKKH